MTRVAVDFFGSDLYIASHRLSVPIFEVWKTPHNLKMGGFILDKFCTVINFISLVFIIW
jgi:hypothetical protein